MVVGDEEGGGAPLFFLSNAILTLVLYKGDIFLEPRIFEVRLLEILKNSGFQVFHGPRIFEVLEKNWLYIKQV